MKYRAVAIGDAVVDYFYNLEDAHLHANLDHLNRELCLNFADKIPVKSVTHVPLAGNAANFAVGARRLGLTTAFYTNVADDPLGKGMLEYMKKERIASEYITVNKDTDTLVHAVLNFQGERTILVYHRDWKYELPDIDSEWIYLSSVAEDHLGLHEELTLLLKKKKIKLGFNPGTFQLRKGLRKLKRINEVSDVFIVNKEEAQLLLELKSGTVKDMLVGLKEEGPKIVVITDGQSGSFAFDGQYFYELEMFPGPRIEATGAGDSYSTAFIVALIYGRPIEEAMAWGSINAQSVVSKIGPQAGLLTLKELEKYVRTHPHFRAHKTTTGERVTHRA
jgi:sugar/nucleoside kinase (ribokinase family)